MSDASLQADSRRDELDAIIEEVIACERIDQRALDRILRRHPKEGRGIYSKREILSAFRDRGGVESRGTSELAFAEKLRTCPTRSLSGVTPGGSPSDGPPTRATCQLSPAIRVPGSASLTPSSFSRPTEGSAAPSPLNPRASSPSSISARSSCRTVCTDLALR